MLKSKIKLLPSIGVIAVAATLGSLAYAAIAFPPTVNPTVVGYVAQPVLSNFNLLSNTTKIYRGEYEKGGWSGNLSCYPVSNVGVVGITTPCWGAASAVGAASVVDKQGFASGSRNIATRNATGGAAFTLAVNPTALVDAAHVNFIRGDRSQESPAGTLRTRLSVLGDTIHSRPYYQADATNPTVFYGANDGMLHAINATTGAERWAYIPSMLIPKLPSLWAGAYVHENFVDGNVNVTNAGTAATPQNILVGVLGSGGKGIYALDVTTLTATSDAAVATKSLWEITPASAGYANLGDTYSNPTLYPVETGQSAVIVGNGYNNTGSGVASLLVIDTKTGALIKEISTGSGTLASPNGLSTPAAIDVNNNGRADFVYAGDIDGNMWKFDLSNASPTAWSVSLLYSTKNNAATPAGQAITMVPGVARHPSGGYMVTFATGRILTATDQADTAAHYVYGIWDGAPTSNTTLAAQTIKVRPYGSPAMNVRVVGSTPEGATITPNYAIGKDRGWQASLPAGERVVGDTAFIQYGRFFFNATNPTVKYTPAGLAANSASGENWLMELDYLTGGASSPFFDMNGDGALNAGDRITYQAGDVITAPNTVGSPITTNFGVPVGFLTSNGVQSQPILGGVGTLAALFYNQNFNLAGSPIAPKPPTNVGIGGGHFDVESFYHTTNNSAASAPRSSTVGVVADYAHKLHDHEYDKKWNVNGVNLLNPSGKATKPAHWLGESVNATTPYKVLVFNQAWNRSVEVQIGSSAWISTKDYQTQNLATVVAGLQTYTGNTELIVTKTLPLPGTVATTLGTGNIIGLQLRMPYNAFAINDWWGDGVSINGLIPLDSSCVKGNAVPAGNGYSLKTAVAGATNVGTDNEWNAYIGPNGERHDGALTIQVIRADTPAASIVLNVAADVTMPNGVVVPKEKFGYRVRNTDINKYVMHEESVFWHHDTAPCMSGKAPGSTTALTVAAKPAVSAKPGAAASCSGGGTVIPADPLTCTGATVTPAKCTTGTYTRPTPSYPLYPAAAAVTGWSPAMPLDRSDSVNNVNPNPPARPCGTNDPHDASFTPGAGAISGGTGTTTPPPATTTTINLIGGAPVGAVKPPVTCTAGSVGCTCVGSVCTTPASTTTGAACTAGSPGCVCVTTPAGTSCNLVSTTPVCQPGSAACTQNTKPPRTGRMSWRELIN